MAEKDNYSWESIQQQLENDKNFSFLDNMGKERLITQWQKKLKEFPKKFQNKNTPSVPVMFGVKEIDSHETGNLKIPTWAAFTENGFALVKSQEIKNGYIKSATFTAYAPYDGEIPSPDSKVPYARIKLTRASSFMGKDTLGLSMGMGNKKYAAALYDTNNHMYLMVANMYANDPRKTGFTADVRKGQFVFNEKTYAIGKSLQIDNKIVRIEEENGFLKYDVSDFNRRTIDVTPLLTAYLPLQMNYKVIKDALLNKKTDAVRTLSYQVRLGFSEHTTDTIFNSDEYIESLERQ